MFGHMEALLLKKRTLNGHFSRPAETDPYIQETQGNHELSPNSDENNPFNQTN